ncbi:hypothetical protein ACKWTF_004717 [Chironomus riparius]
MPPKKNKRKFFGGKSNKNKSAKLEEENASKQDDDVQQKQQKESESEENNQQEEEMDFRMQKSSVHASTQSVTNDSTIGQLELANLAETNVTKMGGTMSCDPSLSMPSRTLRWCSEPNLNNSSNAFTVQTFRGASGNQIATIKLKVIQFIGEIPKETRDIAAVPIDAAPKNQKKLEEIDEEEIEGNESMAHDNVENNQNKFKDEHESEKEELGTMPKLDHFKEDEANEPQQQIKKRFDDNYRVESPKQISSPHISAGVVENSQNTQMTKRHAMLIQEISESSSSEEVKQFLDNEACAIESINSKIMKIESPKEYRVDSPASSDDCNKNVIDVEPQQIIVQEIVESSSNESVKNEILDSMSKQPAHVECETTSITIVSSKVINIKELPSENNSDNNHNNNNDNNKILTTNGAIPTSPTASTAPATTKVKLFECKSEKKLNKAEEAIIEALYGNSNLLQIPNTPLDVISEEGSDCSDIERQNSASKLHDIISNDNNNNKTKGITQAIDDYDEDEDDDVFLPTTVPNDAKYHRQRILQTLQKQRATRGILEQPQLINTKIIEAESNVQESCKSWETKQSDSELQAELVYLTSTSSSATDLSERSNNTDTEDVEEDTSEDTETNSLLENISVPSLYNVNSIEMNDEENEKEHKKHEHVIDDVATTANSNNNISRIQYQQLQSSDYYQEINEQQKLPDILEEEDEEQQARSILDIIESQQQIEDVNKELHHLVSSLGNEENKYERKRIERKRSQSNSNSENVCEETITVITCDSDKKLINEKEQDQNIIPKAESKSGTPTPTQIRRKYSSDSSTSSSNSQCTIIRQIVSIDNVHALKDLCMQSINNTSNENEGKITIHKKLNSLSRNAPSIPIINELELHYECDNNDLQCRENVTKSRDKVITILQVPPEMNSCNNNNQSCGSGSMVDEKERWFGMQSSQMPNLMVALSPLQKDYMNKNSQDSNSATTSADVLLDMHKKFVERRAYHEEDMCRVLDDEINGRNSNDTSRIVNISISSPDQLKDSNLSKNSSSNNECAIKSNRDGDGDKISDDNNLVDKPNTEIDTMNAIRNLILRESAAIRDVDDASDDNNNIEGKEGFQVNKYELENELRRLDCERKELEEELKNIQSLQHFKREEFLYQQKKLDDEERMKNESQTTIIESHSSSSSDSNNTNTNNLNNNNNNNVNKYVNDDFNDFINSNEKLHQEIYNEWQDKVYERTERKLQKMLKITSINDNNCDNSYSEPPQRPRERAASERIVPLNDEFLARVKERQKRLSLPLDDNLDASTESLLNDGNETENGIMKKKKKKVFHADDNKENFPVHFQEFIEYCEQEIVQSKNSVESGNWSEQNRSQELIQKKLDSPPPAPVWSPKSAPPSPTTDRKFRPVPFESPTLSRKKLITKDCPSPPPWTDPDYKDKPYQGSIIKSSSLNTISSPRVQQQNHVIFRKAKADQFNEKFDKGTQNTSPKDKLISFKTTPLKSSKSNELVYSIKQRDSEVKDSDINNNNKRSNNNEATISTVTTTTTKKMTTQQQNSPKKIDGVGPTTSEGMPLSLRSEVTDMSRDQWYKKMYNTIHKAKDDDNYVTVKYKTRRGIPYKSNGYASEPDTNYDSDYIVKYSSGASSDRQRTISIGNQSEDRYGSMEQPVKPLIGQYKIQPGRIENYTPGKSSVSDKEAKQWWDDIMEIFDGHLEQQKLASNYTQGNLSRALKDQGYQSDSTLVFKKKNDVEQLSPVETKIAYRSFQEGGEVPLHGFRKHAPEKPKVDLDSFTYSPRTPSTPPLVPPKNNYNLNGYFSDSQKKYVENDVNIHYKVPVRYEFKHAIPDDELARQQAEHMKKVYQEERRRKYLQELQDMNNRRHTDNFTPSQKSPIALNRYDDFAYNIPPPSKSPVNLPGTVARALYSFQGQSNRELSFKKGDIIYIRRQIDKNWYEGEHNATIGLLPVQYVDIIANDGSRPTPPLPTKKPSEGQARAKYNFVAQSDIELSLNKGELVSLTRRVDPNWFEGRIGNRKGIFPVSYVDVLTDIGSEDLENDIVTTTTTVTKTFIPTSSSPIPYSNSDVVRETKTIRKTEVLHVDTANEPITYRAVYNYRPVNSDELELREGDLVYVLEQCDDGWYVGTNSRTGFFGTFPGNYTKRVY